jgi:chromosome segregation ATPase
MTSDFTPLTGAIYRVQSHEIRKLQDNLANLLQAIRYLLPECGHIQDDKILQSLGQLLDKVRERIQLLHPDLHLQDLSSTQFLDLIPDLVHEHQQEVKRLQSRVVDMNEQIKALIDQNVRDSLIAAAPETKLHNLETDVRLVRDQNSALESATLENTATIVSQSTTLADLRSNFKSSERELAMEVEQLLKMQKKHGDEVAELLSKIESNDTKVARQGEHISTLEDRNLQLENALEEQQSVAAETQSKISSLESQAKSLDKHHHANRNIIKIKDNEIMGLKSNVQMEKTANSDLQKQTAHWEAMCKANMAIQDKATPTNQQRLQNPVSAVPVKQKRVNCLIQEEGSA